MGAESENKGYIGAWDFTKGQPYGPQPSIRSEPKHTLRATPGEFPHGEWMHQIFDMMKEGAKELPDTDFPRDKVVELSLMEDFVCIKNNVFKGDVFYKKDTDAVLRAMDIYNVGQMVEAEKYHAEHPESKMNPEMADKLSYYKHFIPEIETIIQKENIKNDQGEPLSAADAFKAYSVYLVSQFPQDRSRFAAKYNQVDNRVESLQEGASIV